MNAYQLDGNGAILNIIVVDDLNTFPNLVDAELHPTATIGDSIIEGVLHPLQPDMTKLRAALLKKVDTDVDAIYAETIGHRATEYTLAEEDAKLYKEAGYTGVVPESVQSWATAKSQTATWAADDILATATNWRTAQAAIRGTRLLRKEQARVAADAAALSSVEAQWTGFVTAIRASLGLA